jgi:hypothetical protein
MTTKTVVFHVTSYIDRYSSIACGAAQHTPMAQTSVNVWQRGPAYL